MAKLNAGWQKVLSEIIKKVILLNVDPAILVDTSEKDIVDEVLKYPEFGIIVATTLEMLPVQLAHTDPVVVAFVETVIQLLQAGIKKETPIEGKEKIPLPEAKKPTRNRGPELDPDPTATRGTRNITDPDLAEKIHYNEEAPPEVNLQTKTSPKPSNLPEPRNRAQADAIITLMEGLEAEAISAENIALQGEQLAASLTEETSATAEGISPAATAVTMTANDVALARAAGPDGIASMLGSLGDAAMGLANTSSLAEASAVSGATDATESGSGSAVSIGGQPGSSIAYGSNTIGAVGEMGGTIGVGGAFGVATAEGEGEGGVGGLGDVAGEGGAGEAAGSNAGGLGEGSEGEGSAGMSEGSAEGVATGDAAGTSTTGSDLSGAPEGASMAGEGATTGGLFSGSDSAAGGGVGAGPSGSSQGSAGGASGAGGSGGGAGGGSGGGGGG